MAAPKAVQELLLAGVFVVVLGVGSVLTLSPRCDQEIGDETDPPPFTAIARTICGAETLLYGG